MLIADEIQRLSGKQLFSIEPDWRNDAVRQVHVCSDIHLFLFTRSSDRGTNKDRRRLLGFFESFVAGDFISATLEPLVMETDMKRLSPGSQEVWEIKIGDEKFKQWRVFGRFAEHNHFVALTGPTDRTNIDVPSEIIRCQGQWRTLFGNLPVHYGSEIHDYITPS